ncbi:MAG TPA: hypothetical protein VIK14_09705 [Ignavibacteria bacterium]
MDYNLIFKLILVVIIAVGLFSGFIILKYKLIKKRNEVPILELPIFILEILPDFIYALFIVVLAASVGPYVIEHLTNYTINTPYKMTASEATYYTLQALIAIVIGKYISKSK